MTKLPVAMDITRLITRLSRDTPNGIDRVDMGYARRLLLEVPGDNCAVISLPGSPRVLTAKQVAPLISNILHCWGEADEKRSIEQLIRINAAITSVKMPTILHLQKTSILDKTYRIFGALRSMLGAAPIRDISSNFVYLNVSQFPVWRERSFCWLDRLHWQHRWFFLHDILPLNYPEFFPARELTIHTKRLHTIAKYASRVIVSSTAVADSLAKAWSQMGLPSKPIHTLPLFADNVFTKMEECAPRNNWPKYFVACGTVEPRKNYLRLLEVWRGLAEELGAECPRLLLIGGLGWNNEQILDLLTRSPKLNGRVMLITGCTSAAMSQIMNNASALLMPSFAEGFGFPLVEAAARNLPIISSDNVAALNELQLTETRRLSAIDGKGWAGAIKSFETDRTRPHSKQWILEDDYFSSFRELVDSVC